MKHLRSVRPSESARAKSAAIAKRFDRAVLLAIASAITILAVTVNSAHESYAPQRFAQIANVGIVPGGVNSALILVVVGIVLNGLYVAGATAVDLLRPMHVRYLKEDQESQRQKLQFLIDGKPQFVAACVVASAIIRLSLVFVAFPMVQVLYVALIGRGWESSIETLITAGLVVSLPIAGLNLIAADLIPRSYAALHPHRVSLTLFQLVRVSNVLFWIPAWVTVALAGLVTARFGGSASFVMPNQAEEEIKNLVESAQETGEIEVDEKELLHSVFEFSDTVAREVMTPRVDVDALPVRSDPELLIKLIRESGHSRIPLYEDTDDQIVGIIHAKDLLLACVSHPDVKPNLRALMRPALFVPENKNLHELLTEMRSNRSQMAVVQDEFGGTAGIITSEDIVEELVGDIVDEYDVEEPDVVAAEGGFIVDGRTHLDDVNSEIGSEIESEDFDTIGGYVFGLFGRQPEKGDCIEDDEYRFTIASTDGRRILKIKIDKIDAGSARALAEG